MSGRKRKPSAIGGAFVAHSLEMRRSPAWRHLPDPARRILFRIEEEHMLHGGAENGRLPVTYANFSDSTCGVRRASIALAIRQCVELGFLEVTRAGGRAISDIRQPSLFGLTYVVSRNKAPRPDTWQRIKSDNQAREALVRASQGRRYATQPAPKAITTGRAAA